MAPSFSERTRGGESTRDGGGGSGDGEIGGVGSALRYVSLGVALGLFVAGLAARRYRDRGESSASSTGGRPEETEFSGSSVYVWRPTRDDVSPHR
ncbi:hypothetical protein [Halopelagius fulvigenes]|uniref:Uncharacterized protein n=1 Tax=Halopelagius fulvigenes TaxID=1198324 RepID=A0ABD5TZM9_9EURY